MRTWPAELMRLAVRHLAADEDGAKADLVVFEKHLSDLQAAFTRRPLGDAAKVSECAKAFATWADELTRRLEKSTVDDVAAKRLVRLLPTTYARTSPDYDSARQIGWAYEVLWNESSNRQKPPAALAEVEKYLKLRLPQGRMDKATVGKIDDELSETLTRMNAYRPESFRLLLEKLER